MPANTLAWSTHMVVPYDPSKPDAVVAEKDIVGGCSDCPVLQREGLSAFLCGGTRKKFATVLCDEVERLTPLGITLACRGRGLERCTVHERIATIGGQQIPLHVLNKDVVETGYEHHHRTDHVEIPSDITIASMDPADVERAAQEAAAEALLQLEIAREDVLRAQAMLSHATPERQRAILVWFLHLREMCVLLRGRLNT